MRDYGRRNCVKSVRGERGKCERLIIGYHGIVKFLLVIVQIPHIVAIGVFLVLFWKFFEVGFNKILCPLKFLQSKGSCNDVLEVL